MTHEFDAETLARMHRLWGNPPGFVDWLRVVNHRDIGRRFIVTSVLFFFLGGIEALIMRVQLASPMASTVDAETFNQLFTMHGSTMMFLFVVPFFEGLFIYLVPLMIGTRDMIFPRLNAFGYWVYLFSGIILHVSLLLGVASHSGWFNYVPLAGPGFSPGVNIDLWVTMITFIEVSALAAAVELIVTIMRQRAPGMSLHRIPVFIWSALVMATMIIFAMPPLIVTSLFLGLDRLAGTHFFNVAAGGEPLLWQHLFWFFGHPDVYIMLVPALGIVSTLVPLYARVRLAGHLLVTLSLVAIGFLSFGLWVHHMYAAGIPLLGANFFGAASMMITVPSGVVILTWIVTIWQGRPLFCTAFLFIVGFIVLLILGGITGIMVAVVPFDWQVHDTYFVVAHFHYVLVGGVVLPIFAAVYAWFPKIFGVPLRERLGRLHFWTFFLGVNVTFFPMHLLGFAGMPRRVYTYQHDVGWDPLNLVVTLGAFLTALGAFIFVLNVLYSLWVREPAPADPWKGGTLEWLTSSPPPPYNFALLPVVASRDPLWTEELATRRGRGALLDDVACLRRQVLLTTTITAEPDHLVVLPGPSMWPLWLALSLTIGLLGAIASPWFLVVGGVLSLVALAGWFWAPGGDEP